SGDADGELRLWDVPTGKLQAAWQAHENNNVCSADFSSDGKLLATGSSDGTAKLWDVGTRKQRAILRTDGRAFMQVRFSPDGRMLATTSEDGILRLWDVKTGKLIASQLVDPNGAQGLAFPPDGKWLAAASRSLVKEDQNASDIKVWKVSSLLKGS